MLFAATRAFETGVPFAAVLPLATAFFAGLLLTVALAFAFAGFFVNVFCATALLALGRLALALSARRLVADFGDER
jgi:hypothetical protein